MHFVVIKHRHRQVMSVLGTITSSLLRSQFSTLSNFLFLFRVFLNEITALDYCNQIFYFILTAPTSTFTDKAMCTNLIRSNLESGSVKVWYHHLVMRHSQPCTTPRSHLLAAIRECPSSPARRFADNHQQHSGLMNTVTFS